MAIIKAAEIHFVKCNPKRPNAKYNKKNPTWEVQIRVYNNEEKKKLQALHLKPKAVREDPDDESSRILYWRVNLRKKSIKEDGEKADPVKVVNGNLDDVDPDTIGNGSIANVRIFQYDYKNDDESGVASVLMGIQLTKHILYKPKARDDDFEETETETVAADDEDEARDESDGDDFKKGSGSETKSSTPSAPPKKAVAGF